MNEHLIENIENNEQLLNKHGWFFELEGNLSAKNTVTGCSIEGELTLLFLNDKLIELLEDSNSIKYPDEETLLENNGYTAICLSPLEVENTNNGEFHTGECALWLVSHLREKWLADQS